MLILTIITNNSLHIKDYGHFKDIEDCKKAANTYVNIFDGKSTPYKKLINYECINIKGKKCLIIK